MNSTWQHGAEENNSAKLENNSARLENNSARLENNSIFLCVFF